MFQRQVVHSGGPVGCGAGGVGVAKHDRGGAEDLYVHAVAVHLLDAQRGVPQRGVDGAEGAVARHDLSGGAVAVGAQPGGVDGIKRSRFLPRDRREEMGVHIDFLDHV
ncbi:hypothetical protein D3C71_1459020 [compost metagenome]